jgi:DNA adenine methylase
MSGSITSLAPWFGSKRTIAPSIVQEIGPHNVYWEIFCGSMAVILAKPPCRTEVVSDLHGDLVNLARCIQHPKLGPALYRRLRRVMSCETTFRESLAVVRAADVDPMSCPDIDRAYHYFIASWQGMNGVAGTSNFNTNFARRFSSLGGDTGARWSGGVRSIPNFRKRLERVQVLQSDGIELASKIEDREGTVIYADPPYLVKGAKYKHDFAEEDHARLAEVLGRFRKTRVVVSYYADPRLAGLYPGWNVRPIDVAKSMVNSGKRDETGATKAPEVLLVNGPLAGSVTPGFSFADQ